MAAPSARVRRWLLSLKSRVAIASARAQQQLGITPMTL
eukprot:CAMPEP_0117559148 /NCGR_PEP_ID=MMETSP0784-20121206/53208_1 /TAXON_ID=39447 /ORGANISM="" /LENGTH=37 /DNA_ID= /DNA_START= /DNA_END= /DNA_ORIENTATION=